MGSRTSATCRCGRVVASPRRSATPGLEVEVRDVDADLLPALAEHRPDCVVPLLHGETGEDGSLREVLELVGVPYVGARPTACLHRLRQAGGQGGHHAGPACAPRARSPCPHETFRELGAQAVMAAPGRALGTPLMVKPTQGGSALGCTVVREPDSLPGAMVDAYAYGSTRWSSSSSRASRSPWPSSTPVTGPRALSRRWAIEPDGGVYDYTARYTAGSTEFVVPAKLSDETGGRGAPGSR